MALGGEDVSVARTHGGADVFGLAGFLRDDDLISHDGLVWKNRFDSAGMRTYREQYGLASCAGLLRAPTQPSREVEHNLAKVGVEGSNPFARSNT
jgi:hypothetical protein